MKEKNTSMNEDLPEFEGEAITIGHELIDGNNHLNHKHYFGIWEEERVRFLTQDCKINLEEIEKSQIKLVIVYVDRAYFRREVFENDQIIVKTSVENKKFHYLQFYQRMIRGEDEVAKLSCSIFAIQNGHTVDMPREIGEKINSLNSEKRR